MFQLAYISFVYMRTSVLFTSSTYVSRLGGWGGEGVREEEEEEEEGEEGACSVFASCVNM